jgi:hypothetical protein
VAIIDTNNPEVRAMSNLLADALNAIRPAGAQIAHAPLPPNNIEQLAAAVAQHLQQGQQGEGDQGEES